MFLKPLEIQKYKWLHVNMNSQKNAYPLSSVSYFLLLGPERDVDGSPGTHRIRPEHAAATDARSTRQ